MLALPASPSPPSPNLWVCFLFSCLWFASDSDSLAVSLALCLIHNLCPSLYLSLLLLLGLCSSVCLWLSASVLFLEILSVSVPSCLSLPLSLSVPDPFSVSLSVLAASALDCSCLRYSPAFSLQNPAGGRDYLSWEGLSKRRKSKGQEGTRREKPLVLANLQHPPVEKQPSRSELTCPRPCSWHVWASGFTPRMA